MSPREAPRAPSEAAVVIRAEFKPNVELAKKILAAASERTERAALSGVAYSMGTLDWSAHDGLPEVECVCKCGRLFESHCALLVTENIHGMRARKPCPECGSLFVLYVRSGKEPMTISGAK